MKNGGGLIDRRMLTTGMMLIAVAAFTAIAIALYAVKKIKDSIADAIPKLPGM